MLLLLLLCMQCVCVWFHCVPCCELHKCVSYKFQTCCAMHGCCFRWTCIQIVKCKYWKKLRRKIKLQAAKYLLQRAFLFFGAFVCARPCAYQVHLHMYRYASIAYVSFRCRFYHFSEFCVLCVLSLSLRVSPTLFVVWCGAPNEQDTAKQFFLLFSTSLLGALSEYTVQHVPHMPNIFILVCNACDVSSMRYALTKCTR